MVKVELEARLALGEAEKRAGRASATARLRQLSADAAARGYRLIARQAEEVRLRATGAPSGV
jgi:hypothetical protein